MKNVLNIASAILTIAVMSFTFASCEKDAGKLPNISFKTGGSYTSADATIAQNTAATIGISASKAENKDVLTKFTITRSYDGANAETVFTKDLSGGEGDNYAYDYSLTTRSQAGTEMYTFTVVNKDGLTNNVSLTLTVQ